MVLEKVAQILAERVDCDASEITRETACADLGIDSLDVTELAMDVEDEFGIELELDASVTTVGALVDMIEAKQD